VTAEGRPGKWPGVSKDVAVGVSLVCTGIMWTPPLDTTSMEQGDILRVQVRGRAFERQI
jgi:hypothetical protein